MVKRRVIAVSYECKTCDNWGEKVVRRIKKGQRWIEVSTKMCVFCSSILEMTWIWNKESE